MLFYTFVLKCVIMLVAIIFIAYLIGWIFIKDMSKD